ncbi:MAG: carboxypeptidase regulatory-like domain-containing protein [Planctomycetota bacterium]
MNRSLCYAVLLLAAAATAGWFLLRSPAAPTLPQGQSTGGEHAAAPAHGTLPSIGDPALTKASAAMPERAAAALGSAPRSITPGLLTVRTQWPDGAPAGGGVALSIRGTDRSSAYRTIASGETNEHGIAQFEGIPAGRWSLRSHRGDRLRIDVTGEEQDVAFELEAGVDVSGFVLDANARPVARASIWLQTRDPKSGGGSVVGESNGEGQFHLTHIPIHISLGAFAPNHGPSALVDLDEIDTTQQPATVTLKLTSRGGTLRGRVTNSNGAPIANARLGIGKESGRIDRRGDRVIERWSIRTTRSDSHGRYALEGLTPGEHAFTVFCEGYGFARSMCEVRANETSEHDVAMQRAGTLRGIVTDDAGQPMPGATVHCYDVAPRLDYVQTGQIDFEQTFGYLATAADQQGRYALHNVTAGSAHVFAQPGGRFQWGEPVAYDQTHLEITPDGVTTWNPSIGEGLTISGVVLYRDGNPMPHHFVMLTNEENGKQHTQTNNGKGAFRFIQLASATYSIRVQYWDAPDGTPPLQREALVPGQGQIELRAPFDKPVKLPPGAVLGRIDDAGLRIRNPKALRVSLSSDQGWFHDNGKVVDGAFRFENIKPCRFQLSLLEADTVLATSSWFDLLPGAELDTGVLRTVAAGTLDLRIERDEGAEAIEPKIWLQRDGAGRSTQVRPGLQDSVQIDNLTPGDYNVLCTASGTTSAEVRVTIRANSSVAAKVILRPGQLVRMTAWFPEESPPKSYRYVVTSASGEVIRDRSSETRTQPTRPLQLACTTPKGSFRVELFADGKKSHEGTYVVTEPKGETEILLDPIAR